MTIPFEESYHGQLRKFMGNQRVIVPAVRGIVQDEHGHILFVKRSDNGDWVLPAGSIELNESVLDALKREVWEESGLSVQEATLIAIYSEPRFHFTNSYGGKHQMLAFVFQVTQWTGTLCQETDETVAAEFFAPDALPPNIYDFYRETLQDLNNFSGAIILK
ncbi:NUDIX domain-containing protein [Candidatus Leptofilum sp.]|uniref:NUDIX domain-containing protein n=1 Tax=Candidatus Leptofilum sp. TaxID=3241576 RepID=UPI003B5C302A